MKIKPNFKVAVSRIRDLFLHYKNKGLFKYIARSILLIIFIYAIIVLIVFLTGKHLVDFNRFFESLLDNLSDTFVLILFFISESFLGLVVVDLFVVWTQKFSTPYIYLAFLGVLSYIGAIISYRIGRWIAGMPRVKAYSERKLSRYMDFAKKWGGAFIIIAALFPFTPFSMAVIALALLRYPHKLFLLFSLSRLVRFVIQGYLFFDVLKIDSWIV